MSTTVNATELAALLGVTSARVSQYVSSGKLAGCFEGDGRSRRFHLEARLVALRSRLDPDQALRNGQRTQARLALIADRTGVDLSSIGRSEPRSDSFDELRGKKLIEDARSRQLANKREEGMWVFAAAVPGAIASVMEGFRRDILEDLLPKMATQLSVELGCDRDDCLALLMDVYHQKAQRKGEPPK